MAAPPAPDRLSIEVYASRHARPTLAAAYLLTGDWAGAEEAAAHALAAGHRMHPCDERSAIAALVRRHVRDRWSWGGRSGGLQLREVSAPPTAAVGDPGQLWLGLAQLTERERAAVVLRGQVGLDAAQTAAMLRLPPADVVRDLETADAVVAQADPSRAAADRDLEAELSAFFAAHAALARPTAAIERRAADLDRRRIRTLRVAAGVGVASLVALAAAGLVVLRPTADTAGDRPRTPPPTGPPGWVLAPRQPALPSVGPNRKLVGFQSVVVAVPASWRQVSAECGAITHNAVVFAQRDRAGRPCGDGDVPPGLSAVSFDVETAGEPEVEGEYGPRRTRAGTFIVSRPAADDGRYVAYAAAPSLGFGMSIVTDSRRTLHRIIDSMTALPPGYTTVPDCLGLSEDQVVTLLRDAGLVAQRLYDHSAIGRPMEVVQQSESVGAVVPLQTRVTLGMLPR
jgi:hypothetical protein